MAKIKKISAGVILDSRGEQTLEVRLTLSDGKSVVASVPQGKSTGSHEAKCVSAERAVMAIEKIISPKLRNKDPKAQKEIDDMLIRLDGTPNKRALGANALLAVSIAVVKAGALAQDMPLWKHIQKLNGVAVKRVRNGISYPRLYINAINGGLHAGNNLDFQEYLVIPKARALAESVAMGTRIYRELGNALAQSKGAGAKNVGDEGGFAPDFKNNLEPFAVLQRVVKKLGWQNKIDFGLDAAVSAIAPGKHAKLTALYKKLTSTYPCIYLEDPFGEEEFAAFAKLRAALPAPLLVAGDDLTTTNVKRMEKAYKNNSVNAVIIKPNQIGTVSEALDAARLARKLKWGIVVSHRSGETNDDFIADFAYGVGADGFKLGAPCRGERIAKYNRLLKIESSEI